MASLMGGSEKIPQIVEDLKGVIYKEPNSGPFDLEDGGEHWAKAGKRRTNISLATSGRSFAPRSVWQRATHSSLGMWTPDCCPAERP